MSMSVVTLLYLIASVCFIQALKGLSNPKTARIGNTFGMAGMAIAIDAGMVGCEVALTLESKGK